MFTNAKIVLSAKNLQYQRK